MELALQLLADTLTSPWVYLLIFIAAGLDSLLPVVPSETVLITAAAYAAAGVPHPLGLIVAATLGAVLGDFVSHLLGRFGGGLVRRWTQHPRLSRVFARTETLFSHRGGSLLIVGRFIPGGRTAATITSGVLGYPFGRFFAFDSIGALAWAVYSTGIGLLGGVIFEDQPLLGVAMGIGIALGLTALTEAVRRVAGSRAAPTGSMMTATTSETHRTPTQTRTPDSDVTR